MLVGEIWNQSVKSGEVGEFVQVAERESSQARASSVVDIGVHIQPRSMLFLALCTDLIRSHADSTTKKHQKNPDIPSVISTCVNIILFFFSGGIRRVAETNCSQYDCEAVHLKQLTVSRKGTRT